MPSSTPSPDPAGAALRERLAEIEDLGAALRLLAWDQQVTMPPGAAEGRGEVMATLGRISHAHETDPALGALLEELAAEAEGPEAALVRVASYDHHHALRVPEALVGELAVASCAAQQAWLIAREERDFGRFVPSLAHNVELCGELAACFPEAAHPYHVILASSSRWRSWRARWRSATSRRPGRRPCATCWGSRSPIRWRRTPAEVLRGATGQDLDPGPLLAHLRARYGALYDL